MKRKKKKKEPKERCYTATLHHTSPNHTSLHLSTLHFLSFTLHYLFIWLNLFFPSSCLGYRQLLYLSFAVRKRVTQDFYVEIHWNSTYPD